MGRRILSRTSAGTPGVLNVVEDPDWVSGYPRLIVRTPDTTRGPVPVRWVLSCDGEPITAGTIAAGEQLAVVTLPELESWMDSSALIIEGDAGLQATCIRPVRPRTRAERKADEAYPGLVHQPVVPLRGAHRVVRTQSALDPASGNACTVVLYQHWSELLEERRQRVRGSVGKGGKRR